MNESDLVGVETLPIWVADDDVLDQRGESKGVFSPAGDAVLRQVPVESLKKNLRSLSQAVMGSLADLAAVGRFQLKEVVLQVEISASGGVALIGTASLGGKGAITLKFQE